MMAVMRVLMLSASLCLAAAAAAPQANAQSATPTSSPKGAYVYFHYPLDGSRVPQRFIVRIGLKEMGVAPAGVKTPNTGHHHLLIDAEPPPPGEPIPSDYNHIHLGNGQTEVVVTLPPGQPVEIFLGFRVDVSKGVELVGWRE